MIWRSNVARACAALFAMAVIVSGCGDDEGEVAGTDDAAQNEPANEKSAVAPDMSVVVLGDSIPYNSPEDCSGCVGFADSYGEALGEELGEPVGVKNLSRHDGARTRDIVDQLTSGELTEPLASADVVILSVGLNDQPPYVYRDQPCHADEPATDAEAIDAVDRHHPGVRGHDDRRPFNERCPAGWARCEPRPPTPRWPRWFPTTPGTAGRGSTASGS